MAAAAIVPHQLSTTEKNIIAKLKTNGNFHKADFKMAPVLNANGYLGEYSRIEMTIFEEDGERKPTIHRFFMKIKPAESGWATQLMMQNSLYEREVSFYKDVSGLFRSFISTDVYPKCFLAAPGKIVLEDLAVVGYRPHADMRLQSLDLEHAKQGVTALARLHSASLIYEERTGKKCNVEFPTLTTEPCYKDGSVALAFLESGGRAIASLAPHIPKYRNDPEAVSGIQANVTAIMMKLKDYFAETVPFRQVICHGDAWPANFLYQYDSNGKLLSAMLIDFQMTRYRPPAYDLMVFMYLSLAMRDLKNWRQSLFDLYYETVSQELTNAGLEANSIYSRDEFRRTCIYYQVVGLIFSLLFFPFSRITQERMAQIVDHRDVALRFYYEDRGDHLIESYNIVPTMAGFIDAVVEEAYENFIRTTRGYTELTP